MEGPNPFQLYLIDFNNPFPPTHSIPPVLKGCFLTSEVVLHLCVKVLRPSLKFTIYWPLYNVSCRSLRDFALCLAVGPTLRKKPMYFDSSASRSCRGAQPEGSSPFAFLTDCVNLCHTTKAALCALHCNLLRLCLGRFLGFLFVNSEAVIYWIWTSSVVHHAN